MYKRQAKASEQGLTMDGQPLVRFIVDEGLKHGKFDVIAEAVAAPIISQLRNEEMERYGLGGANAGYGAAAAYPAPVSYTHLRCTSMPLTSWDARWASVGTAWCSGVTTWALWARSRTAWAMRAAAS